MQATIIETAQEAMDALPGLYVVRSGSEAYFPVMGLIEAGYAVFRGEVYDDEGRAVTVEVTTAPEPSHTPMMRAADPERRMITIGPEFFITALKDYKDWPIKWWREAEQRRRGADARHGRAKNSSCGGGIAGRPGVIAVVASTSSTGCRRAPFCAGRTRVRLRKPSSGAGAP